MSAQGLKETEECPLRIIWINCIQNCTIRLTGIGSGKLPVLDMTVRMCFRYKPATELQKVTETVSLWDMLVADIIFYFIYSKQQIDVFTCIAFFQKLLKVACM